MSIVHFLLFSQSGRSTTPTAAAKRGVCSTTPTAAVKRERLLDHPRGGGKA